MFINDSKKFALHILICIFSLFLFSLFSPVMASAEVTEEHFSYQVYSSGDSWINEHQTAGGVNGTYGTCSRDAPSGYLNCSITWDFVGFPEIPVDSTIDKVIIKIYAGTSGNSGQFNITFNGGVCDLSFPWQNNTATYIFPKNYPVCNTYYVPAVRSNFSLSSIQGGYNPTRVNLDAISVVVEYSPPMTPTPTPTQVPTPTATPTPTPPEPFLDLPFKYEGKEFYEVATNINSYFDHTYPLLSSGLGEPVGFLSQITTYENEISNKKYYSSHDGYDYGSWAGVNDGDPVLAAASGYATYKTGGAVGNMILIDHMNGFRTRYMHLYPDGMIVSPTGQQRVFVEAGQQIGKVGHTGNCYSLDRNQNRIYNTASCAHIHFDVTRDKEWQSGEGNFVDNIPDGMTDPFGWEETRDEEDKDPDPWEDYSFYYNGKQRAGSKSYYLWKKKLPGVKETVASSGATFTAEKVKVEVEPDTFVEPVTLNMNYAPSAKSTDSIWSVGPVIEITAKNLAGDFITLLTKPVKLIWYPFKDTDLARFKAGSFYLYSSKDGNNWTKETEVNPFNPGEITLVTSHFSYFAIMGERKDMIPPTTTVELNGVKGQDNWFRSDVELKLSATDSADIDPSGVKYIYYKINDGEWILYEDNPVTLAGEKHYEISYYSSDNDGNIGDVKSMEFDIDKTSPIVNIKASPSLIWPPNGKMEKVQITGNSTDENLKGTTFKVIDEYGKIKPEIKSFGEIIQLEAKRNGNDKNGRVYTIQAEVEDLAGNTAEASTAVIVPHDKGK